jgi:ParB family chromosome partitioning protein
MTNTVTIDQLRPGYEYPGGSINSRKEYTRDQINSRKESILAFGILQSLLVCPAPGKDGTPYYVGAGGLRLVATQELVKEKKLPPTFEVPILVKGDWDAVMALSASIEENRSPVPPHPVETFEQFSEVNNRGKSVEDMAKLYGMGVNEIRGVLALGRLSPTIRKAWKSAEFGAESAKAFLFGKDHAQQDAVYKRLKSSGKWQLNQPQTIRQMLVGDQRMAPGWLNFVGREAYEAAGGGIKEDLFGKQDAVGDMDLLKKLVDEKIEKKCSDLVAGGWSWAKPDDALDANARHYWPKIGKGANSSKDDKAKSGCIVNVNHQGQFDIAFGICKPGTKAAKQAKPGSGKKATKPKEGGPVISNAIAQRMSEWLTYATGDVIAVSKPEVILALALAGIASTDQTVAMTERGLITKRGDRDYDKEIPEFADLFKGLLKHPLKDLQARFARVVGNALDFQTNHAEEKPFEGRPEPLEIAKAIDGDKLNAAIRQRFDAADYFKSVSAKVRLAAIEEAMGSDHARTAAKLKGAEQAAFCVENLPKTKWLPPELRTSHYDGPAAKKATVTKLKPKAKTTKKAAHKKAA